MAAGNSVYICRAAGWKIFAKSLNRFASISRAWLSACGGLFSVADELRIVLMGRRQCGMDLVLECFEERGRCHTILTSVSLPEDK